MTQSAFARTVFAFVLMLGSATFAADAKLAADWPQFRGPGGQGASDATGLPEAMGEGQNVKWKTPIHGKAWSSPVVMGDQVWLTTATEKGDKLSVLCVDRNTGKVIHDLKLFDVITPQYAHPVNSYASPTPVVENGRVYVSFGSPGIACLDAKTGAKIWERRDFVCNHFRGAGSSPILWNDLLINHFDGSDFQYVAAVNKSDGKTVWKTDRSVDFDDLDSSGKPKADGDYRKAFSTPRVAQFGDQPVLLSLGSKALDAYDPRNGEELWRVENHEVHSGSATPVIGKDLVYVPIGLGRNQLLAIRPGGSGDVTKSHVAWKVTKNVPGKPSPVLVDDLLYFVDDKGIAVCVEAATGNPVWQERLKGNYSASPIAAGGRIYFFGEDGTVTVIAAGREFKQLSQGKFADGFMASPAVSGSAMFLRTRSHLYRVESAQH